MNLTYDQVPIPTDWRFAKLKNLPIEFIDGDRSARYPKRDELVDSGVLFLNTSNIVQNTLDLSTVNFITPEKFAALNKGKLRPMDIIITTRGSIGKLALFNCKYKTGFINAQMLIIRSYGSDVDQHFLFYVLASGSCQELMLNFASGSAQPQLPIRDLTEIPIPVPPVETQRKIAGILSTYDDLIENNNKRIKLLEQAARDLYREWFIHFRFPGHEDVEMVDSETDFGMIPRGWEVGCLGDIASDKREGVSPEKLDPYEPYVGLEHIPRKTVALSSWGKASDANSRKFLFKAGDILFGRIRAYLHKVAVAPIDGATSTDAIVIVPKTPAFYANVLMCVSSNRFVDFATAVSQGTKMPRSNWKVLTQYPMTLPPIEVASKYDEVVRDIVHAIHTAVFKNRILVEARDLLLPRLVSGELDVNDKDIQGIA